jgi:hypothetical protein
MKKAYQWNKPKLGPLEMPVLRPNKPDDDSSEGEQDDADDSDQIVDN